MMTSQIFSITIFFWKYAFLGLNNLLKGRSQPFRGQNVKKEYEQLMKAAHMRWPNMESMEFIHQIRPQRVINKAWLFCETDSKEKNRILEIPENFSTHFIIIMCYMLNCQIAICSFCENREFLFWTFLFEWISWNSDKMTIGKTRPTLVFVPDVFFLVHLNPKMKFKFQKFRRSRKQFRLTGFSKKISSI